MAGMFVKGLVPKGEAVPVPDAAVATPVPLRAVEAQPVPAERPMATQQGTAPTGRMQLGLRLDVELREALRRYAFDDRTTIQGILEQLVKEYVAWRQQNEK